MKHGKPIKEESYPICPQCLEVMTPLRFEAQEGEWVIIWLCACEDDGGNNLCPDQT